MINPAIIKLRKELHQHPELSGAEVETAQRIRQFVEDHHPTTIIENIGGNGLAVVYEFPRQGTTITIRCELDALPIQEVNPFSHQSSVAGVSHKCGHDGHMAIVAGLVFWLKKQSFQSGKVVLLFQTAEETGQGAAAVVRDEKFQQLETDYVFALHNIPQEPLHSIITVDRGFSAEVQSFILSVVGKESHAAEPENGINPALGLSSIIASLAKLNNIDPLNEDFAILTPVHINMGQKSYGISPARGELHYTIRSWSTEKMTRLKAALNTIFQETCQTHHLAYEVEWLEYFPASKNDAECNSYIKNAALENKLDITERPYPFKFGEDFGWYSKNHKTAMFGLGAGLETPALHHADYDFPNEIIETGMNMFKAIISELMKSE